MQWSARPFVRIFIFYVIGLLLAYHNEWLRTISTTLLLSGVFFFLVLSGLIYYRYKSWRFRWLNGITIGISIILAGIFFTNRHFAEIETDIPSDERIFIGTIVKQPSVSDQSVKTVIKITEIADSSLILKKPLKVMVYFSKDSVSNELVYGDKLLFSSKLSIPEGPKNPEEFDYKSFLYRSGINAIAYVHTNKWEKLGNDPESKLISIANRVRFSLLGALSENGLDAREFAVAAAVLLGYDDQMDKELERDYVRAGAMHILCVSGLHVGIVYLVLNFLFGFLKRNRLQLLIKTILLLFFVWAYALLTGLAPSVWRAALMLSLFIIGSAMKRNRDPYNTLAAAAVIMLIIDPMLLFNLGFQLSYTAVLGILIFYRPLYTLVYIKNPIIDKIWSIVAVSTAAQLGTFPLAAHYFHYLPTYFWLTNIFIFPVSFGIIVVGMVFIVLAWVPLIPQILGFVLSGLVFLMNYIVGLVKHLPANGVEGLYFPWIKVVLVYGLIIMLYNWLLRRRIRFIFPVSLIIFSLAIFQTYHKYQTLRQNRIIVYSINKQSAIDFIQGQKHVLVTDSASIVNSSKYDYHIKNSTIEMGLDEAMILNQGNIINEVGLYYDDEFCSFGDYKMITLNRAKQFFPVQNKLKVNTIIIQGKNNVNIEDLIQCINFELIVIDGSVPYWKRYKIAETCDSLNISYYDVKTDGAFIRDL